MVLELIDDVIRGIYSDTSSALIVLRDEELPEKIVLCRFEVFCEEISQVDVGVDVLGYDEFTIAHTVADPMKSHINSLEHFCFIIESVTMPFAQVLSHISIVGG